MRGIDNMSKGAKYIHDEKSQKIYDQIFEPEVFLNEIIIKVFEPQILEVLFEFL